MHVLLIGPHPFPGELGRGGVERVVQVLRRKLATRHRISLLVPNTRKSLRHTDEFGEIAYLQRPPLPGILSYWSWASYAVQRYVRHLSPDLVHVHDVAGFAWLWSSAQRRRRRLLFTAHGVLEKDLAQTAPGDWLRRCTVPVRAAAIGAIERASRRRFDEFIVINDYLTEAMPDLACNRLHSIPNPVDDVFLHTPDGEQPAEGELRLLQVGLINARKNLLGAIGLVDALIRAGKPARLHVVGPVAEPVYYDKCVRQVGRLGLERAVTFHGEATPAAVAGWMDRAHMLLLLSAQETAPMVVAEAHCRGLPVAARRAFGLPFMVADGINGALLDGRTVEDDARRLRDALLANWDRASIRREARAIYDPDRVADRTEAVYGAMLARTSRLADGSA